MITYSPTGRLTVNWDATNTDYSYEVVRNTATAKTSFTIDFTLGGGLSLTKNVDIIVCGYENGIKTMTNWDQFTH
jgi:hypothetical protein